MSISSGDIVWVNEDGEWVLARFERFAGSYYVSVGLYGGVFTDFEKPRRVLWSWHGPISPEDHGE